jgi:hypothetical protein
MTDKHSVPDWLLERLVAGELPERSATALRERLERCGESARLAALRASDEEILREHPPADVALEVERRRARASRNETRVATGSWRLLVAGSAAAALLAVLAQERWTEERGAPLDAARPIGQPGGDVEGLTAKGLAPHLSIYRRTLASPERLSAKDRVRAGDTLQMAYVAAGQRFGVVASIDARGTVTLHLPERPGPAVQLENSGERALPHAFELDATPGFERFVFVTSQAPFDTGLVVEKLAQRQPSWPSALRVSSLELEKGPR